MNLVSDWSMAAKAAILVFSIATIRYFVIAGAAFFYFQKKKKYGYRKIQKKEPKREMIFHEIKWSVLSLLIFGLLSAGNSFLAYQGHMKIYTSVEEFGALYLLASFVVLIILHDTYFYWVHRFMHWNKIYRFVHLVHHKSTNPTPFAAFSFHPLETLLEAAMIPLLLLVMPLHPVVLLLFALFSNILNVMGHLGYEIFPSGFTRGTFWFMNTSTHHNQHHSKFHCNYGLYFNFWDRIMKINHKTYHDTFETIVHPPCNDNETPVSGLLQELT